MRRSQRRGVTLVELVIAILLIGLMATVVGLSVPRDERVKRADPLRLAIAAARESAIDSGRAITRVMTIRGKAYAVTALPDGSMIADSALLVDRLTGMIESVGQQKSRGPHALHDTGAR